MENSAGPADSRRCTREPNYPLLRDNMLRTCRLREDKVQARKTKSHCSDLRWSTRLGRCSRCRRRCSFCVSIWCGNRKKVGELDLIEFEVMLEYGDLGKVGLKIEENLYISDWFCSFIQVVEVAGCSPSWCFMILTCLTALSHLDFKKEMTQATVRDCRHVPIDGG